MKQLERFLLVSALLALTSTAARADRIVFFKSGKAIVVSAVEEKEGWVFLNFVGGGVLGVPATAIERIEQTDLAQELGGSFGNTIQAPDSTRITNRPQATRRLPNQTGAADASGNPQQPSGGLQRSIPQLPRGSAITNQRRPGGPGVKNGNQPSANQPPANPFGLIPLNTNPNTGLEKDRRGEEKEEDQEDEE